MRRYLATLHEKPDHHKKRFALLVSGGFTLILFIGWTVVRFGAPGLQISKAPDVKIQNKTEEVTPIGTLKATVKDGWDSITSQFGEIKETTKSLDMTGKYQEIRNSALDNNGQ